MNRNGRPSPKYSARIGVFYPWGNLGAFTGLSDAIGLLVEHGYAVDLFAESSRSFPPPALGLTGFALFNRPEACLFFTYNFPWVIERFNKGKRIWKWLEMKIMRPLRRRSFSRFLNRRHRRLRYACFIGVDPEGLVSAEPLARMLSVPLVYWSLLLLLRAEIANSEQSALKALEISASRRALFTIVQDPWRGRALIDENELEPSKIVYVPNAPRGKARRESSYYLHRRLSISPERKIVLYSGSIARGTMVSEIAMAAADWPDDYVLVIQSRSYQSRGPNEYLRTLLRSIDPKKVKISLDPVVQSEFRQLVDSAYIGLALHTPIPSQSTTTYGNVYLMGLSSGKIAAYLRSGLPIIVNESVIGPRELVNNSHCGICVEKPEGIRAALASIFERYGWYSANACRCFDEQLELERHFAPVIQRMEMVESGNQARI